MDCTTRRPNPPLSLAGEPSDHEILVTAIDRLIRFARPMLTSDLTDPSTRAVYQMMKAKANLRDSIARASQ